MVFERMFFAALIIFCSITQGYSRKCFVCIGEECNSKNLKLETCNRPLAHETIGYLRQYHSDVEVGSPSDNYECFREDLMNSNRGTVYKGCIFANIKGCKLPVKSEYLTEKRTCDQCNKDGCNPANQATVKVLTVITTISAAFILPYLWR